MAEDNKLLQSYADTHCNGDRYRAIYTLMSTVEAGGFDPYVDELTTEEANFAVTLLHTDAIRFYGGKENYQKAVRAEQLAHAMDTTTEAVAESAKNPYKKALLLSVLKVLGAVAATVVLTVFAESWGMEFLAWIGPVLLGLAAMDAAESVRKVINFGRIKKLLQELPSEEAQKNADTPIPGFEECMKLHKELMGEAEKPITAQEGTALLNTARKNNIVALVLLPVYFIVMVIGGLFATELGVIGRILGCLVVLAFPVWQIVKTVKSTLATKSVGHVPREDSLYDKLNKRQNLCVLAAILIWGLYFLLAVVGVMVCVTITP